MIRLVGLFTIIPSSLLLTVVYFIFFANSKTDSAALKTFGAVLSVFLVISAAMILSVGVYILVTGHHPMEPFIRQMLQNLMWE